MFVYTSVWRVTEEAVDSVHACLELFAVYHMFQKVLMKEWVYYHSNYTFIDLKLNWFCFTHYFYSE